MGVAKAQEMGKGEGCVLKPVLWAGGKSGLAGSRKPPSAPPQ